MTTKVAAYITLYEDKEAALKCLQAIKSQTVSVDCIFIVDNSAHPLLSDVDDQLLLVHHFPSNIGISEGIILALKWAMEKKYDFLWTFDQDSIPQDDCLAIMLQAHQELTAVTNHQVGIIAPTAYDPRSNLFIGGVIFKNDKFIHCKYDENRSFYECDAPITSGALISLAAAQLTAFPRADLFMDGIDFDYGLKFIAQGLRNFVITRAKLEHNYATPKHINIFGCHWVFSTYSPLRYYYSCRNTTYLAIAYAQGGYKFTAAFHRIKTMILKMVAILIFEEKSKLLKVYACLLGTYHGFLGKLGKLWS